MNCMCGGVTLVVNTYLINGISRVKRQCQKCGESFSSKELFATGSKKMYTEDEKAAIRRKQVAVRRRSEDIQQIKEEN